MRETLGHKQKMAAQENTMPAAIVSRMPHITALRLQNFRNYIEAACPFGAQLNILIGANGMGKTNILEAVSLLGQGRGLRGSQFAELTSKGTNAGWAIGADIALPFGESKVRVSYQGEGRVLHMDGDVRKSFEALSAHLPQLWLTPAMDRLFVESASGRRKFLDRFAITLNPSLTVALASYEKAMRERNRLLADGVTVSIRAWLDSLEETMAVQGTAIALARLDALDLLAAGLSEMPENAFPRARIGLEGELELALRSLSMLEVEDQFRQVLVDNRNLDAAAGRSLRGPHRTDFLAYHAGKDMPAAQCSTGEQKALLVGLILAQANCVAARSGDVPLLLLDEVAAHLDVNRRAALAEVLEHLGGQVWITGTERHSFSAFNGDAYYVDVDNGMLQPQNVKM